MLRDGRAAELRICGVGSANVLGARRQDRADHGRASGIGAALTRRLTARGTRVGLIDRDAERLERVAAELGAPFAVADVRERDALTAAIDDLAAQLGGLDIAVANAGIATGGPLRLIAPEVVEETLDINLLGVWRTASAALPHVLARRGHLLLGRTYPLEPAIDATVAHLAKRSRRVVYPPFLRGLLALRGLLDSPLLERAGARAMPDMEARFSEHAAQVGPDAAARPPARY